MLRGNLLTTGNYSLLVSELYCLKNGANTENTNKHDKISAFRVKIDTLWNDGLYSHSIVAGGLLVTSYTTLLTPRTSFTMRVEALSSSSYGSRAQSAVIKSVVVTARSAIV